MVGSILRSTWSSRIPFGCLRLHAFGARFSIEEREARGAGWGRWKEVFLSP
ncbi:MAG: hypothetical protein RQM90_02120 [Methanoculleus sp.]